MKQHTIISECRRLNCCVDCKSTDCTHAGNLIADCPKYHCDNDETHDCKHCSFMKEHIKSMRAYYKEQKKLADTIKNAYESPYTAFKLTLTEFNTLIQKMSNTAITASIEQGIIEYTDDTGEGILENTATHHINTTTYGRLVSVNPEGQNTIWLIYQ